MPDEAGAPMYEQPSASTVDSQRAYGLRREFRKLCALRPREIGALLVATYKDWSADGVSSLGAALSYFTLFSIAPVLIVVTGVAGLFIGHAAATGQVSPWLERFLSPRGAEAAQLMLQQVATPTGGIVTTIGGVLTLFLGTSALVNELRHSLNIVWRIQEPASQEDRNRRVDSCDGERPAVRVPHRCRSRAARAGITRREYRRHSDRHVLS